MGDVLFIRTDASPTLGSGHFMRMLALAEAWQETGGDVVIGGRAPDSHVERARRLGAKLVSPSSGLDDATWTIQQASAHRANRLVADGYDFSLNYQRRVRAAGFKLAVVDDNGENQAYDADWVVNVNVHASDALYGRRAAHTQLLLGPKYAMIRRKIRLAAGSSRPSCPIAGRLLVTMGGSDPLDVTGRIIQGLIGSSFDTHILVGGANRRLSEYQGAVDKGMTLHHDVFDVASVMRAVDLALAACGGTVWELALLGVPSLVVTLADNQLALASHLDRVGATLYLGDARGITSTKEWMQKLDEVATDERLRARLVASARSLVDGNGAQRVVAALREN